MLSSSASSALNHTSSSDYRGASFSQSFSQSSQEANLKIEPRNYTAKSSTYADVTQSEFPKSEQGFYCEFKEGLILDEYLDAIVKNIPADKIDSAFKTNNNIKVYFVNK